MGKSDPYVASAYRAVLESLNYQSVAFLGFSGPSFLTQMINSETKDFYDLQLGNWNINEEWNIDKKYDLVVCTRCPYFSKDVSSFFSNINSILKEGGSFLVDWGLGDHWRFDNYKIGWIKDGEQEFAYQDNNFLWSTVWDDSFLNNQEFVKFSNWVKKFGYSDVKSSIFKEVPEVFQLRQLTNFNLKVCLLSLWEDAPQLYIILKGEKS